MSRCSLDDYNFYLLKFQFMKLSIFRRHITNNMIDRKLALICSINCDAELGKYIFDELLSS